MTSPEEVQDRCESFKSIHVGKFNNLEEEIEKLPDELKHSWNDRKFKQFLERFKDIIPDVADQKSKKKKGRKGKKVKKRLSHNQINVILPFLPELGYSFDRNVHLEINACYSKLLKYLPYEGRFRSATAAAVNQCNRAFQVQSTGMWTIFFAQREKRCVLK